jgi:hypothetical protein
MSVGLPVLYFFAEERFASSTNREYIKRHLFFGLSIGFIIQLFVITMQTFFLPTFLSVGSYTSLLAERYPGLFIDSGSSSWLLPTLGIFLIIFLFKKAEKSKEKVNYVMIAFLILLISLLGKHQSKAFWVIWLVSLFVCLVWSATQKFIRNTKIMWSLRIGILLVSPLLIAVSLWSFSKLPTSGPLQDLGKRYITFQSHFLESKDMSAFRSLDETRFELFTVTYDGFKRAPWIGNGLGSLPVLLHDPNRGRPKITSELIDVPANFILAILHDVGIFGALFLFLIGCLFVWERMSYLSLFLLLLPFQFGLQVQHADGGFIAWYLLFYPMAEVAMGSRIIRISNWFKYTAIILAIGLPLHYLLLYTQDFPNDGYGADFRKDQLGSYQIQASIYAQSGVADHEFHGNQFEWKLGKAPDARKGSLVIKSDDKDLLIELVWKNASRVKLLETVVESSAENRYTWSGTMPAGSQYVVLKVNRKAKLLLSKNYFSPSGEFRL